MTLKLTAQQFLSWLDTDILDGEETLEQVVEVFRREAMELVEKPCDPDEAADVFFTLISLCRHVSGGSPFPYLERACSDKLDELMARDYSERDSFGIRRARKAV